MLKILVLLCFLNNLAESVSTYDPCIFAKCSTGQVCQKSIDGMSYNCIAENLFSNQKQTSLSMRPESSYTNYAVNYFDKYLNFNPCLSSPCGFKQICRNLNAKDYVCQSELEVPADIVEGRKTSSDNDDQVWQKLQRIFLNAKSKAHVKTLKVVKQNLNDEDYQEMSQEKIENHLSDLCTNKTAKYGSKHVNPLRINQYIICLNDEFIIKNCPRGWLFNTHSEKCEKSTEIPNGCFQRVSPCLNRGKCIPAEKFQYKCECRSGYTGEHCEKRDVCQPADCGKSGVCLSIGYTNEFSHMCWCNNGEHIGTDCERNLEVNPCLNTASTRKFHALKSNPSIYIECESTKPVLKACHHPLVFSEELEECDWNPSK